MTNIFIALIKEIAAKKKSLSIILLIILTTNILLPQFYRFLEEMTEHQLALKAQWHSLLTISILLVALFILNYKKLYLLFGVLWDNKLQKLCGARWDAISVCPLRVKT